jgi:hypothetical protein
MKIQVAIVMVFTTAVTSLSTVAQGFITTTPGTISGNPPPESAPIIVNPPVVGVDPMRSPGLCPYDYRAAIERIKSFTFVPHRGCPEPGDANYDWNSTASCGNFMANSSYGHEIPLLTEEEKLERCQCDILYYMTLDVWVKNIPFDDICPVTSGDAVSATGWQAWITSLSSGTDPLVHLTVSAYGVINSHQNFSITWNERDPTQACGARAVVTDIQFIDARLPESCGTEGGVPSCFSTTTSDQLPLQGPLLALSAGRSDFGTTVGLLSLPQMAPSPETVSPLRLQTSGGQTLLTSTECGSCTRMEGCST